MSIEVTWKLKYYTIWYEQKVGSMWGLFCYKSYGTAYNKCKKGYFFLTMFYLLILYYKLTEEFLKPCFTRK